MSVSDVEDLETKPVVPSRSERVENRFFRLREGSPSKGLVVFPVVGIIQTQLFDPGKSVLIRPNGVRSRSGKKRKGDTFAIEKTPHPPHHEQARHQKRHQSDFALPSLAEANEEFEKLIHDSCSAVGYRFREFV